jgi:hypothetical protein
MKFPRKINEIIYLFAFIIIFLLIPFSGYYYTKYSEASDFANSLAPLLSFFGSVLVFYALKAQVKANRMIQEQFKQSLLMNSIDNLNSRIVNSNITVNGEILSGYNTVDKILRDLKDEQERYMDMFAIGILTSIPEKILVTDYERFLEAYSNENVFDGKISEKANELKSNLVSQGKQSAVYLYKEFDINKDFDSIYNIELQQRKEFKKMLAQHYLHSMPGDFRMNIYDLAFRTINEKYDIFLDSYFKSTFSVLSSVYKSKKQLKENKEYLRNVFTNQEKILLYHYVMTGKSTKQYGMYLIELGIFNMILDRRYFACSQIEQYNIDIEYVKSLIYKEED